MSHEVESMAYVGEDPWHGLGVKLLGEPTIDEMLEAADLNWEVHQKPLFFQNDNDEFVPIPQRRALIRDKDDKMMSITGEVWTPSQPRDALEIVDKYCRAGGASLETAISLRGGRMIIALAKLKRDFEVVSGDKVLGYLMIRAPMEVGKSMGVLATGVRVVCRNTQLLAESKGGWLYKQNHMKEIDIEAAQSAIEDANEQLGKLERRCKILEKMKISVSEAIEKVVAPVWIPDWDKMDSHDQKEIMKEENMPKQVFGIMNSMLTAPGAVPGNGWGALNGVTHYIDHVHGRSKSSRLYNSWIGDNKIKKQRIENVLLEMAM